MARRKNRNTQTERQRELLRLLSDLRNQLRKNIIAAASHPNIYTSAAAREKLFRKIEQLYKDFGEESDRIIKALSEHTARDAHASTIKAMHRPKITRYDPRRTERDFDVIQPAKSHSIAATMTKRMSQQAIAHLRNAFVDSMRHSMLLGETAAASAKRFRDRWQDESGNHSLYRFVDRAGRKWENARYIQMLIRTTQQKVANQSRMDTCAENGYRLGRISDDAGNPCPLCIPWEGRIVSLAGTSKRFPSVEDAHDAGVFHPNCVHRIEPVDEEFDAKEIEAQTSVDKPSAGEVVDREFMSRQKDAIDIKRWELQAGLSTLDATRATAADRLSNAIRQGTANSELAKMAWRLPKKELDKVWKNGVPRVLLHKQGGAPIGYKNKVATVSRNATPEALAELLGVDPDKLLESAWRPRRRRGQR